MHESSTRIGQPDTRAQEQTSPPGERRSFGFGIQTTAPLRCIPELIALGRSLRQNSPGTPASVVLDRRPDAHAMAKLEALYDHIAYLRPEHQGRGWLTKHLMIHYTPFDETLFLDSDCLVLRPVEQFAAALQTHPVVFSAKPVPTEEGPPALYSCFSFACLMQEFGVSWWPQILGGGHIVYRNDDDARAIFARALEWAQPENICPRGWPHPQKPAPDEITLAMALCEKGYAQNWPLIGTPIAIWTPAGSPEVNVLRSGPAPAIAAHFGGYALARNYLREQLRLAALAPTRTHRPGTAAITAVQLLKPAFELCAAAQRKWLMHHR